MGGGADYSLVGLFVHVCMTMKRNPMYVGRSGTKRERVARRRAIIL